MGEVALKKESDRMTEEKLIQEALKNVKDAGFGEVIIKVQDHKIVNIKYEAQRGLTKQERGKE